MMMASVAFENGKNETINEATGAGKDHDNDIKEDGEMIKEIAMKEMTHMVHIVINNGLAEPPIMLSRGRPLAITTDDHQHLHHRRLDQLEQQHKSVSRGRPLAPVGYSRFNLEECQQYVQNIKCTATSIGITYNHMMRQWHTDPSAMNKKRGDGGDMLFMLIGDPGQIEETAAAETPQKWMGRAMTIIGTHSMTQNEQIYGTTIPWE